ncbi:hypothetical protein DM860_008930 [Cuscuta australis]|uniref:Uncharacterized protein n=1 Tax=Cuscuta australis TaxID=267555 RepID=A0A328DBA9_9ASTE|nr:hypothetical protein DM860_008930 [Cuscuta australis]
MASNQFSHSLCTKLANIEKGQTGLAIHIGSNEMFGSESSSYKSTKEILVEPDDPIKRRLFDESSTTKSEKKLKSIKVEK